MYWWFRNWWLVFQVDSLQSWVLLKVKIEINQLASEKYYLYDATLKKTLTLD